MITLREIREGDAENMLEWMHDPDIQKGFRKNMLGVTLEEARSFCRMAKLKEEIVSGQSIHLAVADDTDEYLGTISLKEISLEHHSAEMAISLRKKAQGHGVATEAIRLLVKKNMRTDAGSKCGGLLRMRNLVEMELEDYPGVRIATAS